MTTTKEFDLGDVLSVTTGHLVSHNHIEGVYDVYSHVLNYPVSTLGLVAHFDTVKDEILRQHPNLNFVVYPELQIKTEKQIWEWLGMMKQEYGTTLTLEQLSEKDYEDEAPVDHNNEQFNRDAYELG